MLCLSLSIMVGDAAGGRAAREGALVWRRQKHYVNVSLGGVCLGTRVRKRWRACATAMRLSTFGNDVEMGGIRGVHCLCKLKMEEWFLKRIYRRAKIRMMAAHRERRKVTSG